MLECTYYDDRNLVRPEELAAAEAQWAPLLKQAQAGEACYADSLGWLTVDRWAGPSALAEMEALATSVRARCKVFVVVGVGGSNNAARSVVEALRRPNDGPEILYMGNTLSPHALNRALAQLEGRDFMIDVIAKNFETLEPGASFRLLREVLYSRYPAAEAARRVICTGTPGSALETLCAEQGYTFVPFAADVGGRYSALTHVGLLPMAVAGISVRAVAAGAAAAEHRLRTAPAGQNPALRYAALRTLYARQGYKVEMLASFEPQLRWFYKWWIQLFAESEGKGGKGLFPAAAEYTEELHAVGQYLQEGTPLLFETFLEIAGPNGSRVIHPDGIRDGFAYLDGKDFAEINRAAQEATLAAHRQRLPCLVFRLPLLDAAAFGELFYFFAFACYLSCKIQGVNPFDQPGVEAYKGWMFRALGK